MKPNTPNKQKPPKRKRVRYIDIVLANQRLIEAALREALAGALGK